MTDKRDLKKRIRDRQARTGERYTTARAKVVAGRRRGAVPVLELRDLTEEAARLGFKCRLSIFPELDRAVDATRVLKRIRAALRATRSDPSLEVIRSAMLEGKVTKGPSSRSRGGLEEMAHFIGRAEAGIGGVSEGGSMLALQMRGRRGIEMVLCALWAPPGAARPLVVLCRPAEHVPRFRANPARALP